MLRLTPILLVDEIEPCLSFWVDRLGFQKTAETAREGHLASVVLQKDGAELIYESREAVAKDAPALAAGRGGPAILYCEGPSLAETMDQLAGIEPVVPLRETDYGAAEVFYREPGGNVVGFTMKAGY
ncbi:MAG: hypothetical protein HYZ57_15575 [Acidobacteria bacterium]|nr:hypothetical protein [Acidobacteriota bacterium]MBI3281254.1 hypothetical protein [Acidobacteriota bacterium]